MTEVTRTVQKVLACEEDMNYGEEEFLQTRGSGQFQVSKIRGFRPCNSQEELDNLDPERFPKACLVLDGEITFYQYNDVTTQYEVLNLAINSEVSDRTDLVFATVADAIAGTTSGGVSVTLKEGDTVTIEDYATGNNSGILFFKVVAGGTGTADGGKYIDIPALSLQLEQNMKHPVDVAAFGAKGNYNRISDTGDDDYQPIQNAINYAKGIGEPSVTGPARSYLIGTSLDATDLANGITLDFEHNGIANGGAVFFGKTGENAVIDYSGTQKVIHRNLGVEDAVNSSNPSKLGLLFSRTTTSEFSQFNVIENSTIDMSSDPTAFGGAGTLGVLCKASEIFTFRDAYVLGDTGAAIVDSETRWGITSDYKDITGALPTSNSTYTMEGNTVLDSKDPVGVPLYCKAVVNLKGMCYVNGSGSANETYGIEVEGINRGWDLKIFPEFVKYIGLMPCTFVGSKLEVLAQFSSDRNIDTTTNFTVWSDCEVNFIATSSATFTSPVAWIQGGSGDVMNNIKISAPQEPTVRWITPTNLTTNVLGGYEYESNDLTQFSRNRFITPSSLYNQFPWRMGDYRMWYSANGIACQKSSDPASNADGTSIGLANPQSTVGAAGGASALPATPLGYITAIVNGAEVLLPYYTKV